MASTKLYKDGRSMTVNNNYLDRYLKDGWSTSTTSAPKTSTTTPKPNVPTPPSPSGGRSALMDTVGAPVYDPSRYSNIDDYVRDVNNHMSNVRKEADGTIRNTQTGQVYGYQERESGPNYTRSTGNIIPTPQNVSAPPTAVSNAPSAPNPYASLEYERAQRERAMNAAIDRLNTDYGRFNTNIQQDRVRENNMLGRQLNPFSGRSDYAWGMVNQERARTDRERQEDLDNRIAAIRGGYLDFENAMPGLERERADMLYRQDRDYGLNYAQLFGNLPGSVPTPYMGGNLGNFTGGGGGNGYTAPMTLAAQNQLFNQGMSLREFAQAQEANRAALSGRYVPQEATPIIEELLNLKQIAEQPGLSEDEYAQYRQQGDRLRQQLALMGIDPSLFGSDVNYAQAVQNVATGLPTYDARRAQQEFEYQRERDQRKDYESDRLFEYGVYRDNVGDQQWQREFEQSVKARAEQMGYQWASLNHREKELIAEQQARDYDAALRQMDIDFDRGLELYKATGQMPSYMQNYGVNVQALNSNQGDVKAEVEGLYTDLAAGNISPEQALQRLGDAERLKLKPPEIINELRKTVYLLAPDTDPKVKEQKKKEQKKRQETRNEGIQEFLSIGSWNPATLFKERREQLKKIFGG